MDRDHINAACQCGGVTVSVTAGTTADVNACHCRDCQRRTGAPFGVIAWFAESGVFIDGETRSFARKADSGRDFTSHFCPRCGSSLLFSAALKPGVIGIAAGAFADPAFPPPVRSVWEQTQHNWVDIPTATEHYPRGRSG